MILLLVFSFFFLEPCGSFTESNENNCLDYKEYFWKHLATKTPYRYVANNDDSQISFDGCVPQKIWVLMRHGTRYPGTKFINKMRSNLITLRDNISEKIKDGKGTLCKPHAHNITNWVPQVEVTDQKNLAHEGEDEMIELAERFQNRFPSLLNVEYSNSSFIFRSTATQRSKRSQYYFTVGLFGRKIAHHVWSPDPIYKDPILRFYKLCTKWIKEVDKNPKSAKEVELFKTSETAKEIVKNIGKRLGLDEDLTFEDLELMYSMCSYESAWQRFAPSPWCSVFSKEEMESLEFKKDLKHYWIDGYGHNINFQQACPLMEDLLRHIKSENGPKAAFYFTHSGTILKILSHLGLYYDEFKLTHDKFKRPRLWKTSHIDSFGSNLAFVTFLCGEQLKLLVLHQERPVKLPGCPKEGLCLFDKVMKTYRESFQNCQFSEICKT